MAVCNLFKTLTKETGEFLLFSQYTDDLARMTTSPGLYRVVPSKFLALSLAYQEEETIDPCCYPAPPADILKVISNLEGTPIEIGDLIVKNKYSTTASASEVFAVPDPLAEADDIPSQLPLYLMQEYENGCCVLRDDQKGWNPEISKNLFWNMMFDRGYLTSNRDSVETASYIPQIKWVGSIDIQSYREVSGLGYAELYCWIPTDAQETRYEVSRLGNSSQVVCTDTYLRGWGADDQAATEVDLTLPGPVTYLPERQWVMSFEEDLDNQGIINRPVEDSTSFSFNSIIVLYNVECLQSDGTIEKLYTDIPMGLWWCGDQKLITKYTSNEDIFGQGTSYGLRILSRFTPTPAADTLKLVSSSVEGGEDLNGFSTVMTGFSQLTIQMTQMLDEIYRLHQVPKELLAIFKNSRVNVPYIKEIDGVNYWFVNGKCTGVRATGGGGGGDMTPITDPEIVDAWG